MLILEFVKFRIHVISETNSWPSKRVKNKENCSEICLSGHELATCQKHPIKINIFVSLVDWEDVLWPTLTLLRRLTKTGTHQGELR